MNYYTTLDGEKFDIDNLSREDLHIYKQAREFLSQSPKLGWVEFANFWTRLVVNLYGEIPEITEKPIYKICQDLECRVGIEQGFIEPEEDDEYEREILPDVSRSFSDKGKLLVTFSAADMIESEIDEDVVDFYVSILKSERILPFSYSFRHTPYPFSPLLHDELSDLKSIRYIKAASPISITRTGKEWIDGEITKRPSLDKVREKVAQEISWIRGYVGDGGDRRTLFELYYAIITRH